MCDRQDENILVNKNIDVYSAMYKKARDRENQEEHRNILLHFVMMLIVFIISFLIPLFGLFFYIIWKNDRPKDAKWPGIATILGFAVNIYIEIIKMLSSGRIF